jgi:superfamily I DNA/RNA helicase
LRWLRRGEKDGCVPLATIRSAKGLEYKAVVLAELDGLGTEAKKRDRLLYVAISRAMYHLVVLGSEAELKGAVTLWEGSVAAEVRRRRAR